MSKVIATLMFGLAMLMTLGMAFYQMLRGAATGEICGLMTTAVVFGFIVVGLAHNE